MTKPADKNAKTSLTDARQPAKAAASWTRRRLLASGAAAAVGGTTLASGFPSSRARPTSRSRARRSTSPAGARPYPKYLADYIPEFEKATGAKVNYETPSFPIYNQRIDLELSTQGTALRRAQRHVHLRRPLDRRRLVRARSTLT